MLKAQIDWWKFKHEDLPKKTQNVIWYIYISRLTWHDPIPFWLELAHWKFFDLTRRNCPLQLVGQLRRVCESARHDVYSCNRFPRLPSRPKTRCWLRNECARQKDCWSNFDVENSWQFFLVQILFNRARRSGGNFLYLSRRYLDTKVIDLARASPGCLDASQMSKFPSLGGIVYNTRWKSPLLLSKNSHKHQHWQCLAVNYQMNQKSPTSTQTEKQIHHPFYKSVSKYLA